MAEWTPLPMARLYELYEHHFDRLLRDAADSNVSLGSSNPKKTHLDRLTRDQFETMLTDPANDREAIQLWINRISRGHEEELTARQTAS